MTHYEWIAEQVAVVETDDYCVGDVVEVFVEDNAADALAHTSDDPRPGCRWYVGVRRSNASGYSWAYIDEDGRLDDELVDADGQRVGFTPRAHRDAVRAVLA